MCWVFVSVRGLSPVAASGGPSSSRCAGLSPSRPLLSRGTGSRRAGSVVVAHGPSCSAACGILPDQGSNPCALHWQADSQPLRHQGSPIKRVLRPLLQCRTPHLGFMHPGVKEPTNLLHQVPSFVAMCPPPGLVSRASIKFSVGNTYHRFRIS